MKKNNLMITNAVASDLMEIQKIYSYHVNNITISLEEESPSPEQMMIRWKNSVDKSLPLIR
jgi:L-amino acid N-acyltransferase YncA